jgi:hypothetical protein
MAYASALTHLADRDLENLLRALHREQLRCPIGPVELHVAGLSYLVDKVDFLSGMEASTVRAVLVAVLAERRRTAR